MEEITKQVMFQEFNKAELTKIEKYNLYRHFIILSPSRLIWFHSFGKYAVVVDGELVASERHSQFLLQFKMT